MTDRIQRQFRVFKGIGTPLALTLIFSIGASSAWSSPKEGDLAPLFKLKDHSGQEFDLSSRKGKWTVLYFYPKADTPGCTKQACAFRDSIQKIRDLNAEIYGISSDEPRELSKFREKHRLNFTLLADPDLKVIKSYGAKMPVLNMAKRWTFILDGELRIRDIDNDVDPVKDAERVATRLKELQAAAK